MNADKPVEITLRLTPAAYGLLAAMAAYRDEPDVETCILTQLSENVEAWCEAASNQAVVQELFMSGKVVVKKEAA